MAALLSLETDLEVVAEVGRGDEVVEAARRSGAQVCLLDIEMPGADGIEAARRIATELPGCRSLVVTTFGRPGYLRRALDAGASGFVVKDTPARELAEAVRRVHAGLRVSTPRWPPKNLSAGRTHSPTGSETCSARRSRVLRSPPSPPDAPVTRHRSQLPVRCDRQDRDEHPGRGCPSGPAARLALTPTSARQAVQPSPVHVEGRSAHAKETGSASCGAPTSVASFQAHVATLACSTGWSRTAEESLIEVGPRPSRLSPGRT